MKDDKEKLEIIIPIQQLFMDAAKMRIYKEATHHDEEMVFHKERGGRVTVIRWGNAKTIRAIAATFKLSNVYYELKPYKE